jgi:hypothetical protein
MSARHPILLNSCMRAATAAEARYRIDTPGRGYRRAARVIALDELSEATAARIAARAWDGARFFRGEARPDPQTGALAAFLRPLSGRGVALADALAGADMTLMIAATDDGAATASLVGAACTARGIMTAGLVLGSGRPVMSAVSALRPHARVLLLSQDEDDVVELLTALRA